MAKQNLYGVKRMSHAFLFRTHISSVEGGWRDFDRNIFDDFKSESLESLAFYWIVGHQSHFFDAKHIEDLCAHAIVTFVGCVSQVEVGFNGVESFFLKFICPDLIHESDSTSFLIEVKHCSATFLLDHLEGFVKLCTAVAAH